MGNEDRQASYKDDGRAALTLCYQPENAELEPVSDMDYGMQESGKEAVEEARMTVDAYPADVCFDGEDVLLDHFCDALLLQQVSEVLQIGVVEPAL